MTEQNSGRHKRRPRYSGTHPRRFEERYKEQNPQAYPDIQERLRARGRTPAGTHLPVLPLEVMAALNPKPGEIAVDCTIGYGGHAAELLKRISPGGRLVGFDVDAAQLERARVRLEPLAAEAGVSINLYRANFAGLAKPMRELGIEGYDAILADIGVSSMQIDDPARGFSYRHDGPLDMRMDDRIGHTAADLLLTLPQEELSAALSDLGEEPEAEAIAQRIATERATRPLTRTLELAELILSVKGISLAEWRERAKRGEPHPASLTFQALRMLVNDELGALNQFLRALPYCLRPGGRVAVISFHNGEDRLVKGNFRDALRAGLFSEISDAPIRPSSNELNSNPRAASAKLRWAKRC